MNPEDAGEGFKALLDAAKFLISVREAVITNIDANLALRGFPTLTPEGKALAQIVSSATITYLTEAGIASDISKINEVLLFLQEAVKLRQAQP